MPNDGQTTHCGISTFSIRLKDRISSTAVQRFRRNAKSREMPTAIFLPSIEVLKIFFIMNNWKPIRRMRGALVEGVVPRFLQRFGLEKTESGRCSNVIVLLSRNGPLFARHCTPGAAESDSSKGGIHEGLDGFRVEHREFWLFPTEFHQQPSELADSARPLVEALKTVVPTPGVIAIRNYVEVEEVIEIRNVAILPRLSGLHIWSRNDSGGAVSLPHADAVRTVDPSLLPSASDLHSQPVPLRWLSKLG